MAVITIDKVSRWFGNVVAVNDVTMTIGPGITGLLGSGRSEIAEAIFGIHPADSGTITVAGTKRTIRSIRLEVEVGPAEGLPEPSVINCDNLLAVPKDVMDEPVGCLGLDARARLDQALRYALDIEY